MRREIQIAMVILEFTITICAQSDIPTFKVETSSALVWSEDSTGGAASSTIVDPRTGNSIHKLSYAGIEVSSQIGYERVGSSETTRLLNYTTTIANSTGSDLAIKYGGASIEGRVALPLWLERADQNFGKRDRKDIWELSKQRCFRNGFASSENFFSASESSRVFTVHPQTAVTISSVTKYPASSPMLCTVDGCHLTGTIRFYIQVNSRDFVFVWSGRSVVNCGD
jgi:hypothetical protein